MKANGLEIPCKTCSAKFYLCKSCYRGHRYCSGPCRRSGYEESRRIARKKYEMCADVRRDRLARQQANRELQRQVEKYETDKASPQGISAVNVQPSDIAAGVRNQKTSDLKSLRCG